MSVTVQVKLPPNAERLLRDFPDLGRRLLREVAAEMDAQNQLTIGDISVKKLNFPKEGPTVSIGLRNITNRLRGSLRATKAVISGDTVLSTIGSNVRYAAIHEFGGRTRPHVIKAKNAKALKLVIGGKVVLRKSVNHPGSNMPARRYVQSTLEERSGRYVLAFGTAAERAFNSLGGSPA